jgi:TolA-binding protein
MRRVLSQAKLRPPSRTIRGLSGNTHACEDALRSYERDGIFSPDTLAALTGAMPPTPVSINQLSMAGRRASAEQSLLNARFIHAELIARRAAMLQQFQQMPDELASAAGVQELANELNQHHRRQPALTLTLNSSLTLTLARSSPRNTTSGSAATCARRTCARPRTSRPSRR